MHNSSVSGRTKTKKVEEALTTSNQKHFGRQKFPCIFVKMRHDFGFNELNEKIMGWESWRKVEGQQDTEKKSSLLQTWHEKKVQHLQASS